MAKLARLELTDEETSRFAGQMNDILSYMKILEEVDTASVEPTFQVTGLENVTREDVIEKWCEREDLLATTEMPVESNQIKVKSVITNN